MTFSTRDSFYLRDANTQLGQPSSIALKL